MKMRKSIYLPILHLFLGCLLDPSRGEKMNSADSSAFPGEGQKNRGAETSHAEQISRADFQTHSPCHECYRRTHFPKSIAEKIRFSKALSLMDSDNDPVPRGSEKLLFSRKYNSDLRTEDDGFVPISGPYGTKIRPTREDDYKPPTSSLYKSRSKSRYINDVPKYSTPIHARQIVEQPQSVQRRSHYRSPKVHEELTGKESIANENILGNGNFEIIRGGIYSDQDANEILGSRRIGRGYRSNIAPTYRQNRHRSVQSVQFPPYYQRRVQKPQQPLYYPRAPY